MSETPSKPTSGTAKKADPAETLRQSGRKILERPLTEAEQDLFHKYQELLRKWQKTQRLIGSSDPQWIVQNLFLDSLLFLKVLPKTVASLMDLGSGAGVPGIPLKIVAPQLEVALVESRERRIAFLNAAVRELGLQGIRVFGGRAEDQVAELGGRFDAVAMRCAGRPESSLRLAARFVTAGGLVIASGPPSERSLTLGESVTVPGPNAMPRRFLIHRPSPQQA
jgi:16S rRNA (guanine527-N7)-methyltransferase